MAPPSEAVEPEAFWKSILSEDPVKIRAVWNTLPAAERDAVRAHLRTMAGGEGWTPGQKAAAALALRILEDYVRGDGQS